MATTAVSFDWGTIRTTTQQAAFLRAFLIAKDDDPGVVLAAPYWVRSGSSIGYLSMRNSEVADEHRRTIIAEVRPVRHEARR